MLKLRPALQYSEGRSSTWSGARLINCYSEKADGDKRDDFAVMSLPGLSTWATTGTADHRGRQMVGNTLYVVNGSALYAVDATGGVSWLGMIGGTGPVRMAANYTELCIAAGGTGYVYSGGTLQTPLSYEVSDVIYADGYILWTVADSEQFFISGLDDALTYDGADIASVEGAPDNIVGVVNDHREQTFFGTNTAEVFYNSGNAAFPFERQGNAFIERGCFDRDSIVKIDNTVNFVGDDLIVYTLSGYQPQRISTHAIEYQLRGATYARAFTYTQEGHKFYCLDTDNGSFVFDHATGAWHERQSFNASHWRVCDAISAFDKILLFDRDSGKIFIPSFDVYTEDGDPIAMDIYLPTIEANRERVIMSAFEVTCETGVGNADAPDPQIMLTYSDDGGHRWSNEIWRSLGKVGEYRTRAVWRKLGQFRNRQMRLRITDPVPRLVISYWADIA